MTTPDNNTLTVAPVVLQTYPAFDMSDEQFFAALSTEPRLADRANSRRRVNYHATSRTGRQEVKTHFINASLTMWALQDGTGIAADSSTGFILPNGATRSPDAAWVKRSRLARIDSCGTEKEISPPLPRLCHRTTFSLRHIENRARENAGVSRQWGAVRLVDRSRQSDGCMSIVQGLRWNASTTRRPSPATRNCRVSCSHLSRIWEASF